MRRLKRQIEVNASRLPCGAPGVAPGSRGAGARDGRGPSSARCAVATHVATPHGYGVRASVIGGSVQGFHPQLNPYIFADSGRFRRGTLI
eukprot:279808-Prymnesium_polylepis.1